MFDTLTAPVRTAAEVFNLPVFSPAFTSAAVFAPLGAGKNGGQEDEDGEEEDVEESKDGDKEECIEDFDEDKHV